jgi:hypothetical protein
MLQATHNPSFEFVLGDSPSLSDVASLPIVRGHRAFGDAKLKKWGIVGTGRRIVAARRQLAHEMRNVQQDEEWMTKKLGQEFLTCMFGKTWHWYKCPRCSIPI